MNKGGLLIKKDINRPKVEFTSSTNNLLTADGKQRPVVQVVTATKGSTTSSSKKSTKWDQSTSSGTGEKQEVINPYSEYINKKKKDDVIEETKIAQHKGYNNKKYY